MVRTLVQGGVDGGRSHGGIPADDTRVTIDCSEALEIGALREPGEAEGPMVHTGVEGGRSKGHRSVDGRLRWTSTLRG